MGGHAKGSRLNAEGLKVRTGTKRRWGETAVGRNGEGGNGEAAGKRNSAADRDGRRSGFPELPLPAREKTSDEGGSGVLPTGTVGGPTGSLRYDVRQNYSLEM